MWWKPKFQYYYPKELGCQALFIYAHVLSYLDCAFVAHNDLLLKRCKDDIICLDCIRAGGVRIFLSVSHIADFPPPPPPHELLRLWFTFYTSSWLSKTVHVYFTYGKCLKVAQPVYISWYYYVSMCMSVRHCKIELYLWVVSAALYVVHFFYFFVFQ